MAAAVFYLISWHLVNHKSCWGSIMTDQPSWWERTWLWKEKCVATPSVAMLQRLVVFLFWGVFSPHAAVEQLSICTLSVTCSTSSSPLPHRYFASFSTYCFLPFALFFCLQYADTGTGWLKSIQWISRILFGRDKGFLQGGDQNDFNSGNIWSAIQRSSQAFIMLLITTVSKCQLFTLDSVVKYITKQDLLGIWTWLELV